MGNDNEEHDLVSEWAQHPFTQKSAATFDKQKEASHQALLDVCQSSADPKVVAAFHTYKHMASMASYFRGVKRVKANG